MKDTEKLITTQGPGSVAEVEALDGKERIVAWLKRYISNLTEIDVHEIDVNATFDRYGFDSYQGVVMTFELGEWIGADLDPSDTFDHPSITEFADFLVNDLKIQVATAQ